MGRLCEPWIFVGSYIIESKLSDFSPNNLHHFVVAHSQSKNTIPLSLH